MHCVFVKKERWRERRQDLYGKTDIQEGTRDKSCKII